MEGEHFFKKGVVESGRQETDGREKRARLIFKEGKELGPMQSPTKREVTYQGKTYLVIGKIIKNEIPADLRRAAGRRSDGGGPREVFVPCDFREVVEEEKE